MHSGHDQLRICVSIVGGLVFSQFRMAEPWLENDVAIAATETMNGWTDARCLSSAPYVNLPVSNE
jgi:hypothetical protein